MDFLVNRMEPENLSTLQTQSCLKDTLLLLLLLLLLQIILLIEDTNGRAL